MTAVDANGAVVSSRRRGRHRPRGDRPVEWISRDDALEGETVRRYLQPAWSVLDVGAGIRPQALLTSEVHICVEAHEPHVRRLRYELPDESRFVFFAATWDRVLPHIADQAIDTVFALDVIEHLTRREGWRLVFEALRIARKQVVIFAPLGFSQHTMQGNTDRWGTRGAGWQTHRSDWLPDDFPLPWRIVACKDFHNVDDHEQPLEVPVGAFWAIHTRGIDPRVQWPPLHSA